ncbi:hypothetical protein CWC20_06860 [Pseudoalteromonas aurantia]|uniref:Uncharacterized protein n=1 Tax=Pseudoalteromonas aurantia TaxID=43654 RepID=A0ABY2VZL6_9GAMM|nr:hypothetical protein CWC20_06860 [Pseudoalteromonas aurantia]
MLAYHKIHKLPQSSPPDAAEGEALRLACFKASHPALFQVLATTHSTQHLNPLKTPHNPNKQPQL